MIWTPHDPILGSIFRETLSCLIGPYVRPTPTRFRVRAFFAGDRMFRSVKSKLGSLGSLVLEACLAAGAAASLLRQTNNLAFR